MATSKGKSGKDFEHRFKESTQKDGIFITRLNDTDLSFNGNSVSLFTPSNKCDFYIFGNMLHNRGNLFGIECKSTKYPSIAIQANEKNPERMIKFKQLEALRDLDSFEGVYAGLVLNFRDEENNLDNTYYLSIKEMDKFLQETQKKSINKIDCDLRAIKIESKKLRVNYRYNIKKMIEDITK